MKLSPKAKQKKYERDQEYLKNNITSVNVSFNRRKPEDMIIMDWLNSREESKVSYIKRLILEDMERGSK